MAFHNREDVRVFWSDCDPAGIVFYGNYYRWMDGATHDLFAAVGMTWRDMSTEFEVFGVPIISAHGEFRMPVRYGDVLNIESHVSKCGNSSFTVSHVFHRSEETVAEGWENRVACRVDPDNPNGLSSIRIPGNVREALGVA